MPIIDMPLNELKTYNGINPKPEDFEQYWERALDEMNSTDPRAELIPASFESIAAECFDLYFTGVKGARIHAKLLKPKKEKNKYPVQGILPPKKPQAAEPFGQDQDPCSE
jgi:cephalosporin-C deacetylase